jgi:hypothetical protein
MPTPKIRAGLLPNELQQMPKAKAVSGYVRGVGIDGGAAATHDEALARLE